MKSVMIFVTMMVFWLVNVTAQESETTYGIVTVNQALVHTGPDFAYAAIDGLPLNTSVVVVGRAGDFFQRWDGRQWLQIQHSNGYGWIYARLLRTSTPFNSIPPTGRILPRDRNGRVPEGFDLSIDVCQQWQGDFVLTGNFMAGDEELTIIVPPLQGANVYTVIAVSPTGFRTPFDSETNVITIKLNRLPNHAGTYTWRAAPYWTNSTVRYRRQQVCLLHTGGTFEKPETFFDRAGSR